MQNPWIELPSSEPFVLECDKKIIQKFNAKARRELKIHLEFIPEPFAGNPEAPIILLNLNPGYYERNSIFGNGDHAYQKMSLANLTHSYPDYPFFHFDPTCSNLNTPGYFWYSRKFGQLLKQAGHQKAANAICVVEYFPYYSEHFGCNELLPSQQYSFYLVKQAMKRNSMIIQMRSKRFWQNAIADLKNYPYYYELNSTQNPSVSERNCPDGWSEIVRKLNS